MLQEMYDCFYNNPPQKGAAQGCALSSSLFKVYIDDMIVEVEETKQGVTLGENAVSGWILANDFLGILETPEGLQNR